MHIINHHNHLLMGMSLQSCKDNFYLVFRINLFEYIEKKIFFWKSKYIFKYFRVIYSEYSNNIKVFKFSFLVYITHHKANFDKKKKKKILN